MKKSQSITLTVVAAMGIAARAQQAPIAPAAQASAQTCEERRNAAIAAGTRFTETCGHASTVRRGGFGAMGKGHSGGG